MKARRAKNRSARSATERAQKLSGPSVMPEPTILAHDIAWEESGEEFPRSRLLATIIIAGCRMHLEAYATEMRHHKGVTSKTSPTSGTIAWEEQIFPGDFGDVPEKVYDAIAGDGAWTTATIYGREYVLIATPFYT